ncbi:pentapeptide repeat-containing protein [Microcoleus sp. FACHB-1515]|uniref:pentapeptide repeat-containing protein n=1 Tax=Cyanophyceae TaxID=3028117 RepID=UPI001683DF59|nr:pentapeptide repeat-containing protein [Microcoleus sp. FACHB-1515]MBD2090286.1 pentapeptide repeat-containing protein [Microcoleus sp. FACHB-1515]
MADEEHLRILGEGVDRWNQWRKDKSILQPNLYSADLSGANLRKANLRRADLKNANLRSADLSDADLSDANLSRAILSGVNLSNAILRSTNLSHADLNNANLNNANLRNAGLNSANLNNANLSNAYLIGANLSHAILWRTQALGAILRGAQLTGAGVEDWHINRATQLDGVICDYIFLKGREGERRPSNGSRIFAPGDFTKLIQKSLETVDLIFSNGIDWKAFALSLEDLRVEYEEQELSIQAIENKNDAFVIRLNVPPDADKGAIERQAMEFYETRLAVLEAQYRSTLQAKDEQIAIYREQSTNMTEIVKLLASKPIDVRAIAMADNQSSKVTQIFHAPVGGVAGNVEGNMNVYSPEQRQTLAEAATEIQQLLEQLSQTYPTTTQAEKLAVAAKAAEEIEANPVLRSRVIGALKAGGVEALKELVDHPLVTILLAALEGWQQPDSK